MSVGLFAVRLLYRFYVCVHLSKRFEISVSVTRLLSCRLSFYTCSQRLAALRRPVPESKT
jgi:hypothetical protein